MYIFQKKQIRSSSSLLLHNLAIRDKRRQLEIDYLSSLIVLMAFLQFLLELPFVNPPHMLLPDPTAFINACIHKSICIIYNLERERERRKNLNAGWPLQPRFQGVPPLNDGSSLERAAQSAGEAPRIVRPSVSSFLLTRPFWARQSGKSTAHIRRQSGTIDNLFSLALARSSERNYRQGRQAGLNGICIYRRRG